MLLKPENLLGKVLPKAKATSQMPLMVFYDLVILLIDRNQHMHCGEIGQIFESVIINNTYITICFILTDFCGFYCSFSNPSISYYFGVPICGAMVFLCHCWVESTRFEDSFNTMEKVIRKVYCHHSSDWV